MKRICKGDRVQMTAAFKRSLVNYSSAHRREFGTCVGVVLGFLDYHNDGDVLDIRKIGPEVDVRWQPSNLRYAYHPKHLKKARRSSSTASSARNSTGTR